MLGQLGQNLLGARGVAGLSRRELAERVELTPLQVWLLERGWLEPQVETILSLAGALDASEAVLLAGIRWDVTRQRFIRDRA
jgi:transcriptional regulator with XRE-family HTH domain